MWVCRLTTNNLRNHSHSEIEFCNGLNIISGANGSGKTTILESIALCSYSKSFLPTSDNALVRYGEKFYSSFVEARSDINLSYHVSVKYSNATKKQISSSFGDSLSPKDIIGELPVVVLSPDFKTITFGSPQERRRFIDGILSQTSKFYLSELLKLKRMLRQRNSLLQKMRAGATMDYALLDTWTQFFIESATEIVFRRNDFIRSFIPFFNENYSYISDSHETVSIDYKPNTVADVFVDNMSDAIVDKMELSKAFHEKYEKLRESEIVRGMTLFGPQKDEILIKIGSGLSRTHASQGQHKSLLISLKFAEFEFIRSRKNETPIVLLDDIFAELDAERSIRTLELLTKRNAQTLITMTEDTRFREAFSSSNASFIKIDKGNTVMSYEL